MSVTYVMPVQKATATRTGPCPTCGKTTRRSWTFERTVSPFNKRPDGTPKSSLEVHHDVKADAAAWAPEPDVFEHEKCRAARLAPPVAEPVRMDDKTIERSARLATALREAAEWIDRHGLPGGQIQVSIDRDGPRAEVLFPRDGEALTWARALGVDPVTVEDGGHCTYARLHADIGGLAWSVHGIIDRPHVGDRLGDAPVTWRRDDRGRRTGYGTVALDELAAGMARIGIPEVLPARAPGSTDIEVDS